MLLAPYGSESRKRGTPASLAGGKLQKDLPLGLSGKKATSVAFFFGQKKVGVPADLVLVST
jgi:hypothetical protein